MRNTEIVTMDRVRKHLNLHGNAVPLPYADQEFVSYRVLLEASDVGRIVLWFEHAVNTHGTCWLKDADPVAAEKNLRIQSFLRGDNRRGAVNLKAAAKLEPVFVTDSIDSPVLYTIDGSHRLIAQQLGSHGFDGVPAFVLCHGETLRWEYIPSAIREKFAKK